MSHSNTAFTSSSTKKFVTFSCFEPATLYALSINSACCFLKRFLQSSLNSSSSRELAKATNASYLSTRVANILMKITRVLYSLLDFGSATADLCTMPGAQQATTKVDPVRRKMHLIRLLPMSSQSTASKGPNRTVENVTNYSNAVSSHYALAHQLLARYSRGIGDVAR